MKEYIIGSNEAGQRFDKYLMKLLKEAPSSFIYKMLRKKNIVLNGKKCDGKEKLNINDSVKIFLADDTFDKFAGKQICVSLTKKEVDLNVIYEDEDILLINKPAGLLSQKADNNDDSINDRLIQYLINNNSITAESLKTFKPSICNRLDRNTSGIIIAGKSLNGLQTMAKLLKDRTIHKYYLCIVKGIIKEKSRIKGYIYKDEAKNTVMVKDTKVNDDYLPIETGYYPLSYNNSYTLLCVHLVTGKTHQIRAHLSAIGHPLIGDTKYGDKKVNAYYKDKYKLKYQLLHSYMLVFPEMSDKLKNLSKKIFTADLNNRFIKILDDEFKDDTLSKEFVWEHGIAEDLEAQL
ncbi:MAG: RluA family pseudouridine synthase [Lachnospiraceae bacterium]|nr:RluA family pseudouridine synthase [Lachnospiraceae bacterium]